MEKKELVSIVIPIYNVEKYLKRCLNSVINQTYLNLEIILVDDGSMDNSGKICDEYAEKDNRIKVIHKENGGVSNSRNIGLKNSTGEYICFIDSDDFVENEYVETMLNIIIEEKVDIAIINYTRDYEKYKEKNPYFLNNKKLDKQQFFYHLFKKSSYEGYLWNKLFKRKMIIDNRILFNENIYVCEDLLFICQLADKCEKFYYDFEKYLYYYHIRKDSALRSYYSNKTATRVDIYEEIIEILQRNKIGTIFIKRDYIYYALVARNELKNIDKETKMKYTNIAKKYISEVVKSKKILLNDKIKLIVMLYFSSIFKFIKSIKNRRKR